MQCWQKNKRLVLVIFLFSAIFFNPCPSLAQTPTIEEILSLPEEKIDIAQAALVIAKGVDFKINIEKYLKQIDSMADSLRERINKQSPRRAIQIINNYLFIEAGFVDTDNEWRTFFLNRVIDEKKGSCLGLSILYLCLAQRLNLPVYLVTVPKHYFVRYDDGKFEQNIETTMKGLDLPDFTYYWRSYRISQESIKRGVYFRNLSKKEAIVCILGTRAAFIGEKHIDDKALADLDFALKFAPDNPEIYFNKAVIYCKEKQYDRAITAFNKAISLDPGFAEVYRNRGAAYELKGEINKAIEDYNQAINLDPNGASTYGLRGHAYRKTGESEKAKKDFDKYIKLKKQQCPPKP